MNQVEKLNPIDHLRTCTEYELQLFMLTGFQIGFKTLEEPRASRAGH